MLFFKELQSYLRKKKLARKETYRSKQLSKLDGNAEFVKPERKERIPIDPEKQLPFVLGKMILLDKPLHWTSFDIVRKLRGILQIKKIGHAGTLDPLATGLLIVCTGKFTKKINEYMAKEKEYTGQITLGAVTPSFDLETEPEQFKDYTAITENQIRQATIQFTGAIEQLPPIYSALKKDGVALYTLARKGVEVIVEPRKVTIHSFEITNIELPVISFKVICSTGTYIRSLANDFGAALGCGGYLSGLRRTKIGEYSVDDAQDMDALINDLAAPQIENSILPDEKL